MSNTEFVACQNYTGVPAQWKATVQEPQV